MLAGAGVVCIIGAFVVALGSGSHGGELDPRSYDHTGSHALATLLERSGRSRHDPDRRRLAAPQPSRHDAGRGVAATAHRHELAQLAATKADLVVVGAGLNELQSLELSIATELGDATTTRQPACSSPPPLSRALRNWAATATTVPSGGKAATPTATASRSSRSRPAAARSRCSPTARR